MLGHVKQTLLHTRFPNIRAEIEATLARTGSVEGEVGHTCRDGHLVTVESRQLLLHDEQGTPTALLEMDRDVSCRHQLERAHAPVQAQVLRERTFLHQMLDTLPSGVFVVHGPDARLVLANGEGSHVWEAVWPIEQPMQVFLETHHIRLTDTQGRTLAPDAWATMRALLGRETVLQQQEVIRQSSGTSLPTLVNAVPLASAYWQSLGEQHQPHHSSLNRSGSEREPLALVTYQDVRLLKEAEYAKEEFIGIAAHELRQPLAVLKGVVGTLVLQTARGHGTKLADWQQELLADLDQATDHLTDLTENLLDVSRLQAGRLVLQRAATDLVALTGRLVKRMQQTTNTQQVVFSTTTPFLEAQIDPQRIEQVLANAIKYSPQGGAINVLLEQETSRQTMLIQVQDHGIGIPAREQARIFGRFMRADNAQAAGVKGTGLGLYLSRALVEQHGGQLWFHSREGVGSTFFLRLSLTSSTSSSSPQHAA